LQTKIYNESLKFHPETEDLNKKKLKNMSLQNLQRNKEKEKSSIVSNRDNRDKEVLDKENDGNESDTDSLKKKRDFLANKFRHRNDKPATKSNPEQQKKRSLSTQVFDKISQRYTNANNGSISSEHEKDDNKPRQYKYGVSNSKEKDNKSLSKNTYQRSNNSSFHSNNSTQVKGQGKRDSIMRNRSSNDIVVKSRPVIKVQNNSSLVQNSPDKSVIRKREVPLKDESKLRSIEREKFAETHSQRSDKSQDKSNIGIKKMNGNLKLAKKIVGNYQLLNNLAKSKK